MKILVFLLAFVSASPLWAVSVTEKNIADEYTQQVQPLFNNRCLGCHSCFNAPCQLNLQNYDGFERGATKLNVYNGRRIHSVEPTRMWVDAEKTSGWRSKGFFTVNQSTDPTRNLFFQMLELRLHQPQLQPTKLASESQICVASEAEGKNLIAKSPELGMPYGLPALTEQELKTLHTWIAKGAPGPNAAAQKEIDSVPENLKQQIRFWEKFLNKSDLSQKLVSRYLYEHLFLAHLYFHESPQMFFSLVRSKTSCEGGISQIATRRPNDPPGVKDFFYCLKKFTGTPVEKTHLPYELSLAKLNRIHEIFSETEWKATKLPGYEKEVAENPFVAFREIPAKARYQFLLEDAQYEISTFIKGPVCNGSNAVDAIQEQFYVFFLNPASDQMLLSDNYARKIEKLLVLPGMWGSDVPPLESLALMKTISSQREAYRHTRAKKLYEVRPEGYNLNDVWDGDGENPNAILTVFRHFDNAVVLKGAVGDLSKTQFMLDYPLFERLVYNLVVNFDVFGNVGHQFLTRAYMDMIRMEAEEMFLSFLPPKQRVDLRKQWYQGFLTEAKMSYIFPPVDADQPTAMKFNDKSKAKKEMVQKIIFERLNKQTRGSLDPLNWKDLEAPKEFKSEMKMDDLEKNLHRIASVKAIPKTPFAQFFPDVAYLLVHSAKGNHVYTVIHNREHENISWILAESLRMDPKEDTLTIKEGFWASYPNMFFVISEEDLSSFVKQISQIKKQQDYNTLVSGYGVPRIQGRFWSIYDELNNFYLKTEPTQFGYLDLTRYALAHE